MSLKKQEGVTLIELLVSLTVIAIIALVAVPGFSSLADKNRLRIAAEEVYGLLVEARSEAVVRSVDTLVDVDGSSAWCVGYTVDTAGLGTNCDCTQDLGGGNECGVPIAGTNVLKSIRSTEFGGVTMSSSSWNNGFDSVRGTTISAVGSTVTLDSGDWQVSIITSGLGRVRLCTPSGEASIGYEAC